MLIPLRKSMTLTPAATDLQPSENIACVKTVAQVVPVIHKKKGSLTDCHQ